MVAGAYSDAFLVKQPTDVFRAAIRQDKGQHTDFFTCVADDSQAVDMAKSVGRMLQKLMLMRGDVFQAKLADIIERGAEADRVRDAWSTSFESGRGISIGRFFECDIAD